MVARVLLVVAFLTLFAGISSLPVIKPTDEVCQSLTTSCEDLFVASSCKVVKTCISEVWEVLDVPLDKSNVCNICKEMVQEARDQLLSNETQEELREVLEGSCKLIPVEIFEDMCIKMVDEFIPDLIDILVSRMDPDQVCTIAGLCNTDFLKRMNMQQSMIMSMLQSRIVLSPLATSVQKSPLGDCPRCLKNLKPAKAVMKLLPEVQVELLALKLCQDHHKDNLSECPHIVKKYVTPVYNYFYETATNQICVDIQRCPSSETLRRTVPLVKADDDLTCDFCKQLVGSLRNFLEANTTHDELKQAVLSLCEDLGSAAEECQNLLDEYFDMFYAYLLEAVEPQRFCSTIGLCPTSSIRVPLVKMFPAIPAANRIAKTVYPKKAGIADLSKVTPLVKLTPGIPVKYLKKVDPDQIECEICMYLVKFLDAAVEDKKNEEEIKHALEEACKLTPPHLRGKCMQLVDKYVDAIVQIIINDGDPTTVCGLLGLCTGLYSALDVKSNVSAEIGKPPRDNIECELCKTVIEFLEDNLLEDVTKDVLEEILDGICDLIGGNQGQECRTLVDKYIDVILDYITGDVAATAICGLIELCEGGQASLPSSLQQTPAQTENIMDCAICKLVVEGVQAKLQDNASRDLIKEKVLEDCNLLSSDGREKCVELVNKNFDYWADHLVKDLSVAEVCIALEQCPASGQVVTMPESQKCLKDDGPVCAVCTYVVQFVDSALKDKKTEEEIKDALDTVCDLVPESSKVECLNMVNTYLDLIISLIVQDFAPHQVCQFLSLCSSSQKISSEPKTMQSDTPVCTLCKQVIQFVYNELKDKRTEAEIKEVLDKVCDLVPESSRSECLNMVSTYFDLIVSLILQDFTPDQICQTLGLCTPSQKATVPQVTVSDDSRACILCKDLVKVVYDQLKDVRNEEAIRNVLDKACDLVPYSRKEECVNLVNKYYDNLMSLILQNLSPDQVCSSLGLCPTSAQAPALQDSVGSIHCFMCKAATRFFYSQLKDNTSKEDIKRNIGATCKLLPPGRQPECFSFVDRNFDLWADRLVHTKTPRQACALIGQCPSCGKVITKPKPQKGLKNDNPPCTLCKDVVQFVYAELKDNKTEQDVKDVLDEVCNWVPQSSKAECVNMISTYFDLLVSLILQDFTPDQVCQFLGLCPSSSHGEVVCTFCEYVLHFIQNELMDPRTEEDIKEALKKVCSRMPGELSQECQAFVEEYGAALAVLLAQKLDPSIVCIAIRACPKGGLAKQSSVMQSLHLDKCDTCALMIDYMERLAKDKKTDKELAQVFQYVCTSVPVSAKQECETLVKAYGPLILRNIAELGNSREVCQAVDICPKSKTNTHLLGSKKCTYGPSYWCRSEAHASVCNAHEYCKKKIWKL